MSSQRGCAGLSANVDAHVQPAIGADLRICADDDRSQVHDRQAGSKDIDRNRKPTPTPLHSIAIVREGAPEGIFPAVRQVFETTEKLLKFPNVVEKKLLERALPIQRKAIGLEISEIVLARLNHDGGAGIVTEDDGAPDERRKRSDQATGRSKSG